MVARGCAPVLWNDGGVDRCLAGRFAGSGRDTKAHGCSWSAEPGAVMKEMITYLNFDGNTREAMRFYARCLGAELSLMPFSEAKVEAPPGTENRTIHAKLKKGSCVLMASDTMPG